MSDKQLTVAELLAKAGKDAASTSAPRTRRRRSMDSGGISVAELTGNIPKVNAKPQEARHSSEPLDTDDRKADQLDVATLQEAARKEAEARLQPRQQLEQQSEPTPAAKPEPVEEPAVKVTQFEAIKNDRPSNAETIVLSVVHEDEPIRLTTDTFSAVQSNSIIEAPAEDLAKPVDITATGSMLTLAEESLAEAIDEAHTSESAVVEEAAALVGSETGQFVAYEEDTDYVDEDYDTYEEYEDPDYDDDPDNTDTTFIDTSLTTGPFAGEDYSAEDYSEEGYLADDYVVDEAEEEPATEIFPVGYQEEAVEDDDEQLSGFADQGVTAITGSQPAVRFDDTIVAAPVDLEPAYEDYPEEELAEEPVADEVAEAEPYEDEEEEKMSIFAVMGMALIGILIGAGIFLGFLYLWDAIANRYIVAGAAVGVTLLLVIIVHFMRTEKDILSKVLAFIVGLTMTFGPLAVVML